MQETYFLAARVREKEQWKTDCWKLAGSVISKLLLIKNDTSGAVETFAECLKKTGDTAGMSTELPFQLYKSYVRKSDESDKI